MKWLPLLLIVFAGSVHAAVYKHVNEKGEVVYTDTPAPGAEEMHLPELPTYTPPPVPLVRSEDAPAESDIYRSLDVIQPQNDSTTRNNLGVIELQLRIDPALKVREKHRIQFYLDNERYGPLLDKTSIMMSNIDRGEHTLSASVFDADGNVLAASNSVTVFVKRESNLHPKGPPPRGAGTLPGLPTIRGIPTTPSPPTPAPLPAR
jgi:hypothetical protein